MKNNISLIVAAAVVLLILFFLSSGKKAPLVPADEVHKTSFTNEGCVECHAPGKQAPLKAAHPPKEQCLICHEKG